MDNQGMGAFHYVAWSSKSTVADIKPFLTHDVSCLFAKDYEGRSVLSFAVERGNIAMLNYILGLPIQIDLCGPDKRGMSLMHYAVRSKRVEVISILRDHGCDIGALDHCQQSPLHHAAKAGNLEAVKLLLKILDPQSTNLPDYQDQTLLAIAQFHGKTAVSEFLRTTIISPDTFGPVCALKYTNGGTCTGPESTLSACNDPTSNGHWQKGWMILRNWRIVIEVAMLVLLLCRFSRRDIGLG